MAWNESGKEQYCLPQNVPANEFLNYEGKKFSKSRNWGIDVADFLEIFPPDLLRYTLAANLPENRDTDFYWKEFQLRNNSELADIFGNLINRTFTFVHKHFEGKVPPRNKVEKIDEEIILLAKSYPERISNLLENYKVKDGVLEIMNLARAGNKYFNDSEPWKTVKSDKEKCSTTINICLNLIYTLAELFYPVLPFSSAKLFKMLNSQPGNWSDSGKENLEIGIKLNNAEILFPKIEDEIIEKQIEKLKGSNMTENIAIDEFISIDDFKKVQLKVAEVISAERVEKSEKLLKLNVKLDSEERQIVAGIAKSYSPEDLVGKKVIIVANLQPAKLMGQESKGMVLAVEVEKDKHEVLMVRSNIKSGIRVK